MSKAHNAITLPKEELITLFQSGWSTNKLSKKFGVSRKCVDNNLKNYGLNPRNQTEANRLSMSTRTKEEDIRNTLKAHEALRAKPLPEGYKEIFKNQRIKQAKTRQIQEYLKGYGEDILFNYLKNKNYDVVAQKAFDIYNVDIMLNDNIAIELTTLGNPYRINKNAEKTKLLIKNGYKVVWILLKNDDSIINNLENIEYVINKNLPDISIYKCVCQAFERYRNEKQQFQCRPIEPKYNLIEYNKFSL